MRLSLTSGMIFPLGPACGTGFNIWEDLLAFFILFVKYHSDVYVYG